MKQDHKLVAANQKYEPQYIANKFNMSIGIVIQTMLESGKDGKYCRSRKKIYEALRAKGYDIDVKTINR